MHNFNLILCFACSNMTNWGQKDVSLTRGDNRNIKGMDIYTLWENNIVSTIRVILIAFA